MKIFLLTPPATFRTLSLMLNLGGRSHTPLPLVLAFLLLAPFPAPSQSPERPSYHSDCTLINVGESINAQTREVTQYYAVHCALKFIDGKKTRVVWEGRLPLPADATDRDAMDAIARWIKEKRGELIAGDRKGRK